jgi:hypothetical protein
MPEPALESHLAKLLISKAEYMLGKKGGGSEESLMCASHGTELGILIRLDEAERGSAER